MWAMDIHTDPCCCITINSDHALSSSMAEPSPWPWVAVQATHIRLILTTLVFPAAPLFTVHKPLSLSFSPISPTHTVLSE